MKQVSFFYRAVRGCMMLFICTLSFLGSANIIAQTSTESEYNSSDWSLDDIGHIAENPWEAFFENVANAIGGDVSDMERHHRYKDPKCLTQKRKDKLTFKSTVTISQTLTNPPFNLTLTPFVVLPDGRTIIGESESVEAILLVVHLPAISNVPAMIGNYDVGIKVTSTSTDLSILTFFLTSIITTSSSGESVAVGGLSYNLSSVAAPIGTVIHEGQFINNFVFFREKNKQL